VRLLSLAEILDLHRRVIELSGGSLGIRDLGTLKAAVAQPRMTFDSQDLYPSLIDKAAALCFSLVMNHPFVDGNKRVGAHAGIFFLLANDEEPTFSGAELLHITLAVARGEVSAEALAIWLRQRSRRREP